MRRHTRARIAIGEVQAAARVTAIEGSIALTWTGPLSASAWLPSGSAPAAKAPNAPRTGAAVGGSTRAARTRTTTAKRDRGTIATSTPSAPPLAVSAITVASARRDMSGTGGAARKTRLRPRLRLPARLRLQPIAASVRILVRCLPQSNSSEWAMLLRKPPRGTSSQPFTLTPAPFAG